MWFYGPFFDVLLSCASDQGTISSLAYLFPEGELTVSPALLLHQLIPIMNFDLSAQARVHCFSSPVILQPYRILFHNSLVLPPRLKLSQD